MTLRRPGVMWNQREEVINMKTDVTLELLELHSFCGFPAFYSGEVATIANRPNSAFGSTAKKKVTFTGE